MTSDASSPHRILFVLQSVAIGGMETHVVDLASEYVRRGGRVHVVLPEDRALDPLVPRFERAGVSVDRLNTDARLGRGKQIAATLRFVRLMRAMRPGVVHLQTGGATGGLGVIMLARLFTSATVAITEHDVPSPRPGVRQRLARRGIDRLSHLVVAVSRRNATLRRQRAGAVPRRFAAILNGVHVPELDRGEQRANRDAIRREQAIPADAVVAGSVVRLAPGKGLDDLLRAVALLNERHPCTLLLVGEGPLERELRGLAADLGIGDDVRFAGHTPHPERYLDAMDVFVLAVPAGSMSIALLEAMARGLPPVITFCGPEEAVIPGESGGCAPPNDPEGLAAALEAFVTDDDWRRRIGEGAARHVRRHFSIARVAHDYLTAYADARAGALPERLRADGPLNPRPGDASVS